MDHLYVFIKLIINLFELVLFFFAAFLNLSMILVLSKSDGNRTDMCVIVYFKDFK